MSQSCPSPTKRNREELGGKCIETFSICPLLLLLAQLDYSCMPFVREPKLFESFGWGRKIAREIAMPWFLEIQMRIGRNPDENCKEALSWKWPNWNQRWGERRVVCARYLRRNPDFLAVCRMISTQSVADGFLLSAAHIGGQLYKVVTKK